jgi:hypothetical protein
VHYSLLLSGGRALLQRIMGMKEMDDLVNFSAMLVPFDGWRRW